MSYRHRENSRSNLGQPDFPSGHWHCSQLMSVPVPESSVLWEIPLRTLKLLLWVSHPLTSLGMSSRLSPQRRPGTILLTICPCTQSNALSSLALRLRFYLTSSPQHYPLQGRHFSMELGRTPHWAQQKSHCSGSTKREPKRSRQRSRGTSNLGHSAHLDRG